MNPGQPKELTTCMCETLKLRTKNDIKRVYCDNVVYHGDQRIKEHTKKTEARDYPLCQCNNCIVFMNIKKSFTVICILNA